MIKTITYKRILNLGNYESKHLELAYELDEFEEPEAEISRLMEVVERKIREDQAQPIREEIDALLQELRAVKAEYQKRVDEVNVKQQELEEYNSSFIHPKHLDPGCEYDDNKGPF